MKLYKRLKRYWRKRYSKWTKNIWTRGPFQLYRVPDSGTLDISIARFDNIMSGWEYGYRDHARGPDKPMIEIRIGKLVVLYFEKFPTGFEVWILGFWWVS